MKVYLCDKCGSIIKDEDMVWKIDGVGCYGSFLDGERVHMHFCDECLKQFLEVCN